MKGCVAVSRIASSLCRAVRPLSSTATRVNAVGIEVINPTLGLSADQSEFYSLARSFADNEMKPFAGLEQARKQK